MKWIFGVLTAALITILGYLFFGSEAPSRVGANGIEGEYFAMIHSVPHSKERVAIDIYADFTCPACQRLEAEGLPQIRKAYGERVTIRHHYLAGPATPPSAKILYDVATEADKGEVVAADLFAAKLKHGQDAANLPVIKAIAQRHGLSQAFEKSRTDGTGLAKLRAEWKATNGKVAFFPFVVFDSDIAANASTDNLLKILGSLLIPVKGATG